MKKEMTKKQFKNAAAKIARRFANGTLPKFKDGFEDMMGEVNSVVVEFIPKKGWGKYSLLIPKSHKCFGEIIKSSREFSKEL